MKSFNLTEWALGHRAVVLFLILVIGIGGVLGFTKLGQLEDPNFSVPSMTAVVIWPGATAQQIQDQVLVSGPPPGALIITAGVQKMAPGLRVAVQVQEGARSETTKQVNR